ncbi:MAG TPA: baseplate J/gp47 family protein, partial [Thermodesulfobacteriota bacterium]|nr:baseplate J/gp47 family protein [Thermodesulfobacteriota bacterium]
VVVVPYAREGTVTPIPGEGFLQTVLRHLDTHRLVTTDLYVIGPEYVRVSVMCRVHTMKKSSPTEVGKRVQKAIEGFLDPLKGGPDGKGWPFGRSVFPSEIYQMVDGVEGVDYVTGVSLSAEGRYREGDIIRIPPTALVFSGEHRLEFVV